MHNTTEQISPISSFGTRNAWIDPSLPDSYGLGQQLLSSGWSVSSNSWENLTTLDLNTSIEQLLLIGHGSPGKLYWQGEVVLDIDNSANLNIFADKVNKYILDGGDLLIGGCYVGAETIGHSLIYQLDQLTGLEVWASENRSGGSPEGDWVLETSSRASSPIEITGINNWKHSLETLSNITLTSNYTSSSSLTIGPNVLIGGDITISAPGITVANPISGNNDGNADKLTLKTNSDSDITINANIAGGGINSITAQGASVTVGSNSILSTRQIAVGGDQATSPSIGNSGSISLSTITNAGQFPIPGLNIATGTSTISLKPGSALYSFADNNFTAGDITINIDRKTYTAVFGVTVDNTKASISLDSTILSGGKVNISSSNDVLSYASSTFGTENAGFINNFVFTPITTTIPSYLLGQILPASVGISITPAELSISKSTITASSDINITSSSTANASTTANTFVGSGITNNGNFAVAVGIGQSSSSIDLSQTNLSALQGQVSISSTSINPTTTTASVTGNAWATNTNKNDLDAWGLAVTTAITTTNSTVSIDEQSNINAGKKINISSSAQPNTNNTANSTIFLNGKASVGVGVAIDNAKSDLNINGTLTAGDTNSSQLTFQLNSINLDGSFNISSGSFADGTKVTYSVPNGAENPFPTLVPGADYLLLLNNPSKEQKPQSYFLQPSSVILNEVAGSATPAQMPINIQDQLQLDVNSSKNIPGVIQSFSKDIPIYFSSVSNVSNNTINIPDHGLIQGQELEWNPGPFTATGAGLQVGGEPFNPGQPFYAIVIDANNIKLANSPESAASNTALTIGSPSLPSNLTYTAGTTSIDQTTGIITINSHGLVNNQAIIYTVPSGSTSIGGLSSQSLYYTIVINDNQFALASSQVNSSSYSTTNQTQLTFTSTGSGQSNFDQAQDINLFIAEQLLPASQSLPVSSVNPSSQGVFTISNNGFYPGQYVTYQGTSLGGLTNGNGYFVSPINNNEFQLCSNPSDAVEGINQITITNTGSGTVNFLYGIPALSFDPFVAINNDTSIITIANHGLITGDVVNYQKNLSYTSQITQPRYNGFSSSSVNLNDSTITLTGSELKQNDSVIYQTGYLGSPGNAISGLKNNSTYYINLLSTTTDGNQTIQLLPQIGGTPILFDVNQNLSGFGALQSLTSSQPMNIGDTNVENLKSGSTYQVIRLTNNEFLLTNSGSQLAAPLTLNTNPQGSYSFNTQATTPAGVVITNAITAKNKISVSGANGSNPKIKNLLANPALLYTLNGSLSTIFNFEKTKKELSKDSTGKPLTSTSSLAAGGALAVSYVDHTSNTDISGSITASGDVSISNSIKQTQQDQASTSTGAGTYDTKVGETTTTNNSNSISVAQILDFYTNHAFTNINPTAKISSGGNVSINTDVTYPTIYSSATSYWESLIGKVSGPSSTTTNVSNAIQQWSNLLFGGNLGLISAYFNTFAQTKNWGGVDDNGNNKTETSFAYVGIYQQFNNISLTTLKSGSSINANGAIKTNSNLTFNSLGASGIINLSLDLDDVGKVVQGKPLSEVFSPLGNRSSNGVGASMVFQQNAHQSETIIQPGVTLTAGSGGISINATNTANPWQFAQGGGQTSNFGLTGSFPFVTQSIITTAQLSGYAVASTTGALTVAATTNGLRLLGSGSMMWTNSVGIGIGATIYKEQQSTRALIGLAANSVTANAGTNSGTTITSNAVSSTTLTAPTVITAASLNHSTSNSTGLFSLALAGVLSTSGVTGTDTNGNPKNKNQITSSWGLGISGSEAYTSVGAYTQLSINAPSANSIISIGGKSTLANSQTAYYKSGSGSILFSGGKQQPANAKAGGNGGLGLSLAFAQTLGNDAPGSGAEGIIADTTIAIPNFNSGSFDINSGASNFTPTIFTGALGLAGNVPFKSQPDAWAVDGAGSWAQNTLSTSNTLTIGSAEIPTTFSTSSGAVNASLKSSPTIWSLAGAAALVWNGRTAVAAGVSIAQNEIDQATKLNLSNATFISTASGSGPITITSDASNISIQSLAFAGAFSSTRTNSTAAAEFDKKTTIALAGAGAGSYNTIKNNTQLNLDSAQLLTNGSAIQLSLKQQSSINADGGGAALSAAINSTSSQPTLSGSVGASISHNIITDNSSSGISISGSSLNANSNGTAAGAISIQTLLDASLSSMSIGGALAGAYSATGASSGDLAGAGSGSNSTLALKQPVKITNSTLIGSTLTLQRNVKPTIGITSGGFAAALNWAKSGNGGLNGALSVGASVSLSSASLSAPLSISSSTLTASSGALNISTVATPDLAMLSMGGALSLSAGQTPLVNGALAGAGAGATTTYSGDLSASINQSTLSATAGGLSISTIDQASIVSDAGGVAVGIALGGKYTGAVSVGASTAFNTVSLNDQYSITNSSLSSSGGNLSITVNGTNNGNNGLLKAVTLGGSAAVGATTNGQVALALSGAGAKSSNTFSPNLSVVLSGSNLTSSGGANLSGNWAGDLTAKSGAYSLGVGFSTGTAAIGASIGASLASNTITTVADITPSLGVSGSGLNNLNTSTGATISGGFNGNTTTQAIAGTIAIAGSTGGFALSVSGAGSQADTNITLPINANLSIGSLNGGVSLSTTDNNTISTVAGAGSLSVGAAESVGIAVSAVAALANSSVNNTLNAGLTGSGSGAGGNTANQAVSISTSQSGAINTTAVSVAATIAGSGTFSLGATGAGSNATTSLSGSSTASLNSVAVNAGAVSLTASDSRSIDSDGGGYSLAGAGSGTASVAVSIGAAISSVSLSNTVASVVNGGSVNATSLSLSTTASGSIYSLTAAGSLAAAGAANVGVAASGAGCGATLSSNRTLTAQAYGGSSLTIGSGGLTIYNSDTTSLSTDTYAFAISLAAGYAAVAVDISATETSLTLGTQYNTGIGKSSDSSSAINQLAIAGTTSITTNANASIVKADVLAVGAGAAIGLGAAVGGALSLVDITLGGAVASTLINARGSTGKFGINTTGSLTLAPKTNTVGVSAGLVGATFGASKVVLTRNTALSLTVSNSTLDMGGDVNLGLSDTFGANTTVTPVSVGVGGGAGAGAGGGVASTESSSRSLNFSNSSLKATGNITINLQRTLSQLQSQNTTVAVAAGAAGAVGIGGSDLQTTNSGNTSLSISGSTITAGGSLSVSSSYASPDQEINGTVVAASVGFYSVSVTGSYSTLTDTSNTNLQLQQSSLISGGALTATALTTGSASTQVLAVSASLGIGAGLGANLATSTFSPTTSLNIGNASYLQSGGTLTLSSQLNPASSGALSATGALASAVQSGGGVVSGQYSSSTATTSASTKLESDSSSTITAAGNLSLNVGGSDVALTSSPNNVSIGLLGYGGVSSTATTGSSFNISPGGAFSSTGGSLTLNGSVQTASGGTANAVGVAGISVATNLASITNNTTLTIAPSSSANLSAASGLNITGAITSGTLAQVDAISAGVIGVGVTNATATDNSSLNIGAGGNLSSSGGNIALSATRSSLNQSISAFSSTAAQTFNYSSNPGTQALSTASGGGLVDVNAATATAKDNTNTSLSVGSAANLIAKQGTINLSTTGSTTSNSSATGITVGLLVAVGVNTASTTNNSTWSSLIDGVGSLQSGGDISISVLPTTNVSSNASASGGGLVAGNNIMATATATPTVSAGMLSSSTGTSSEAISAGGNYQQQATLTSNSLNSSTSGTTGGAISWTVSGATSTWQPKISSLLPSDANLQAVQAINITASTADTSSTGFSAQAQGNAYGFAGGTGIESNLTVSPSVSAGMGNNSSATSSTGSATINSASQNKGTGSTTSFMANTNSIVGGVIGGANSNTTGNYNPSISTSLGTNSKLQAPTGITITSQSNDNLSVGSAAGQFVLAGVFAGQSTINSSNASITTTIGSGSTLEALQGTITIQSNPGYNLSTSAKNQVTSGFTGGQTNAITNGTINSVVNIYQDPGSVTVLNASYVNVNTNLNPATISSYASYIANWPAITSGDAKATNNLNHQGSINLSGTINALTVDLLASMNAGIGSNLNSSAIGYGTIEGMTIGGGAYGYGTNNSTMRSNLNLTSSSTINAQSVNINSIIGNGGYSKSGQGMWQTNVVCGIPIYGHVNNTGGSFTANGTTQFDGTINAGAIAILKASDSNSTSTPTVSSNGPISYQVVSSGGVNTLEVNDVPTAGATTSTNVTFTNGSNTETISITSPGTNTLLSTQFTNAPYWGGSTPTSLQFNIGIYDSNQNLIAAGNSAYSAISSFSVNGQSVNTNGNSTTISLSPGQAVPLQVSFDANILQSNSQVMIVQMTPVGSTVSAVNAANTKTLTIPSPFQTETNSSNNSSTFTALGFQQQVQVNATAISSGNITIPSTGGSLISGSNWQELTTAPIPIINQSSSSQNILIRQANLPSGTPSTYYPVFTAPQGTTINSFTVVAGSADLLSVAQPGSSSNQINYAFVPSQNGTYDLDLVNGIPNNVTGWSVVNSADLTSSSTQVAPAISYSFTTPSLGGTYQFTPVNNGTTALSSLSISGGSLTSNTALNPSGIAQVSLAANTTYTLTASAASGQNLTPANVLVNWQAPSQNLNTTSNSGQNLIAGSTYTYTLSGSGLTTSTGSPAINISWSTSSGAVTTLPTSPPTPGTSLAGVTLGSSSSTTSYLFKINSNQPLQEESSISWYQPRSSIYQAQYTYTGTGTVPISYTPSGGAATPFVNGTIYSFIYNGNNSISIVQANNNGGYTPYTVTATGSATDGSYGWFTAVSQQTSSGVTSPIWAGGVITGFQAFVSDNFSTTFNSSSFSGNTAVSTNSLNNNLLTLQVPISQTYSNPRNLQLFLDSFTPSSTLPSGTTLSSTPTTASLVYTPAAPSGLSSPVSSSSGTVWGISFTPPVNGTYYTGFTSTNTPANTSFSVTQGGNTTNLDPAGNTGVTLSTTSPAIYTISTTSGNAITEPSLTWYLPGVSWNAISTYNAAQPSPANDGLNRYFVALNQSSPSLFNNLVSNNQILAANGSISLAMTSGTSYPISATGSYGTSLADANQALTPPSSPSLLWHLQSFPTFSATPSSLFNKTTSTLPPIQTTINQTGTSTLKGSGSVNSVAGVGFVAISNTSQSQLQVASINTQTSTANLTAKIGTSSIQIPSTFTGNGSSIKFADAPARSNPLVVINNSTTNSTFTGPINAASGSVIITNPAGSQTWQATAASTSGSLSLSSYGSIELQETAAASITGVNNNSITLSNSIGSNTNQPLMLGFPSDAANAFKHNGLSSGALYSATTGSSSEVFLTPLAGQNASSVPNSTDIGLNIFTGAQLIASGAAQVSSGLGINIAGAAKLQAAENLNLYLGTATFQNNPNNPVLPTGTSSTINGSLVSTSTIQINGSNPSNTQNTFIGADVLSLGRILPNQSLNVQLLGGIDTVKIGMLPYVSNTMGISQWLNGSVTLGALNTTSYNGPSSQNGWEFNRLEFNDSLNTSTTSGSINSNNITGLGMGTSSIIFYNNANTTSAGFTEQIFSTGSGSDALNFNGNLNYTSTVLSSNEGSDTINLTNYDNSASAELKLMAGDGDDIITINESLKNSSSPNAIPNIFLGDGNNSLQPNTNSSININLSIHAENGNNSITGSMLNDTIITGNGNNNINSLSGNDSIRAKDGNNNINLELGNKDVYLGNGNNTVMNTYTASTPPAQPFLQNVRAGWGDDIIDLSSPNIVAKIFTGSGTNYARVTNTNKNTIITGLGSSYVQGGSGSDTYALGPGDQTLITTGGFDRISTGPGNQRLELKSSPITNNINLEFKPGSTVLVGNLAGNQINIAGPGKSMINLVNESLSKQTIKLGTGNTLLKVVNTNSTTPMNEIFASTGSTTVASGSQVKIIATSPNSSIVYSSDSDSNPVTDESFTNNPLWKPSTSLWIRLTTFLKLALS